MEGQCLLPKFLTIPEIRPHRAAVSRDADYVTIPKHIGQKGYLENIADPIGALADRDGEGPDVES